MATPQQSSVTTGPIGWDEIPSGPERLPFVLLVEAIQGEGKTHLACTFPEPIFLLDTENRAHVVGSKFKASGKQVYRRICPDLNNMQQTLAQLVFPHFRGGTVVIDSGSELLSYAEAEWLRDAQKEKVYPLVLWSKVNSKVDSLITTVRSRGFYLVITTRRKPEYHGEQKTGQMVMEGYKRLPYLADVHLLLENGKARVLKNGFRNTATEQTELLDTPHFNTIVSKLIQNSSNPVTWTEPPVPTSVVVPIAPTLDSLMSEGYTPEQILRAAGGAMPMSPQELTEVATVLRARTRTGLEAPGAVNPDDPDGLQGLAKGSKNNG